MNDGGSHRVNGADASGEGVSPSVDQLKRRIIQRPDDAPYRVGVVGLGYVGLPLSMAFVDAGFQVLGFDVNSDRVAAINAGKSHVGDVAPEDLQAVIAAGQFEATTDMTRLAEVDSISICVPTPLGKTRDPDISYVAAATEQVADQLRRGQLIVLESTTYPGTTREVILPRLEDTGLRAGEDFFLAFSPERVDPGNPVYGIKNTPKVIGGIDEASTELATLLYGQAIEQVVPVSTPEVAEMAKLHENTFRSVNIALANETALMCDRLGVNVWDVIQAAATKPFGFMPFFPGPGLGGHCIPIDPYYLSWKLKTLNYRARFIELAAEVNAEMPQHVVGKVAAALNEQKLSVNGSTVLVLGVAYKPGTSDTRESPALDIIGMLLRQGAQVRYSDPYVPETEVLGTRLRSEAATADLVRSADCVVVATNHREFDYGMIGREARVIVDTRNAFANQPAGEPAVVGL